MKHIRVISNSSGSSPLMTTIVAHSNYSVG